MATPEKMKDPSRTYGLRVTVVATGDILSCHSSDSNETNRLFLIFFLVGVVVVSVYLERESLH